MNQKKKTIIENAIGLFAKQGFYSTSIQEIADKSGVSKGSVYSYFLSKDELMVEIFRYYYSKMREKVMKVENEDLEPKEKFIKQIQVEFEELLTHKEFIIMQLREQALSLNKELDEFLTTMKIEVHQWYENNMIQIYGDQIKPYIIDAAVLLDGIKSSFIQLLITNDVKIDLPRLSSYILRRLDDFVRGILEENDTPILTKQMFGPVFSTTDAFQEKMKEEVAAYLSEMQQILTDLSIEKEKAEELQGAIDFLIKEVKKQKPQTFIIKGMLSNFKGTHEFDRYRKLIADKLNIQLL